MRRQTEELKNYCQENGIENVEVIEDLGSGLNYKKKGLRKLLKKIIMGKVSRIIVTYKDRLLRFGTEIITYLCKLKKIELITLHSRKESNYYEELAEDVVAILTVFASRIYGRRSHEKKRSQTQKASETA